ncbi:MAG: transposase [Rhodobacteraceae bacterium]|nr:transposase [Paracoccaceae bacterium]
MRVELDEHLAEGHGEALPEGANPLPNQRNGSSPKTITTDSGKVLPGIPHDRFDPIPSAKDRRCLPEVDTRIVSLCARGMTTRENQGQTEATVAAPLRQICRPRRPPVAVDTCKRRAASRPVTPSMIGRAKLSRTSFGNDAGITRSSHSR